MSQLRETRARNDIPSRKVIVIGLDSAPPELFLERFLSRMPTIRKLVENGISGRMRSCDPPITVPAWMVMMTGMDPGKLGIYGFRNRAGWSYSDYYLTTSTMIKETPIWDIIAQKSNLKSCLIGVPPTYPVRPIMGNLISCFLTPGLEKQFTHPPELRDEIEEIIGEYEFDATFRTDNRDEILQSIRRMTNKRFDVANHLIRQKEWSFFMLVEIGLDRIHHTFWKYFDEKHPRFEPGNKFEKVLEDYYVMLDRRIGELIESGGEDAIIIIASDHGSKAMKGAFCVNEWLIKEGYLKLSARPKGVVSIENASVDWKNTRVWGWGGYYSRIFFNVRGREDKGILNTGPGGGVEKLIEELREKISRLVDNRGLPMKNTVYKPDELYETVTGDPPDLMVYFDDLNWRAAGTIGHGKIFLEENDTGPDDSVHSMDGVFILYDPRDKSRKDLGTISIMDAAPTILSRIGVPIPKKMKGKPVGG